MVWAEAMLEQVDELPQYQPQPYPISLWRIGDAITWVGLGGEGSFELCSCFRAQLLCGALTLAGCLLQ